MEHAQTWLVLMHLTLQVIIYLFIYYRLKKVKNQPRHKAVTRVEGSNHSGSVRKETCRLEDWVRTPLKNKLHAKTNLTWLFFFSWALQLDCVYMYVCVQKHNCSYSRSCFKRTKLVLLFLFLGVLKNRKYYRWKFFLWTVFLKWSNSTPIHISRALCI